ncbi:hypothetical protein E9529_18880 [Blastococcus sp. KM273128]|uniref:hypothetical protein n=1 Tax=Blastococcus sp. KM273128 TaxID=2570314 RepID=UPI001F451EC8|nr:hypothetical protein [Blastococcus sp. KM273128]MCF6746298.1 hypothetical protein [Blastococcus sp. KM273128]
MSVLAHGVGSRTDLPIPIGFALYGAGAVILVSFAVLLLFWRTPRLGGPASGRPLPAGVQRVLDGAPLRRGLQAAALAAAVLVVAAALLGPAETSRNLAPWVLYVTFWVGLVPASLLLGPVWRAANPLRLLHRLLRPVAPAAPGAARLPALGVWPAAASLLAFVWLELVFPGRAEPITVAVFLLLHAVVHVALSLWFGEGWFARGDGFEAYSTLIARLAPWGRRDDGRLVLRNPLARALATPAEPGLTALVVVLLGSTAFDGLSRTVWWQTGPGAAGDTLSGTVGLLASIGVVAALYALGTRLSGRLAGQAPGVQPGRYAATVIPIALGYTVAHYFSLLLLDGQHTWILLSNPFGVAGVDLFGTYGNRVDLTAVGSDAIALVQVGAIITGHVVGVALAHERALLSARHARASDQLPLVVVMVLFTLGGLGLLFGF